MEHVAKLLDSIATLAWPVMTLTVVLLVLPQVRKVIASRSWAMKVAGFELSVEEANKQMVRFVEDLQDKVAELERRLPAATPVPAAPASAIAPGTSRAAAPGARPRRLLWVDDQPKNNAFLVDRLQSEGYEVNLALSTAEALRRLQTESYGLIVTDMHRSENGTEHPTAALELLDQVRALPLELPVVLFTTKEVVQRQGRAALERGARLVTTSSSELLSAVGAELPPAK